MKYRLLFIILFVFSFTGYSQVITWEPENPTEQDSIVVTFHAEQGTAGLKGYTGDIYAHTGVITDESTSDTDWKYVIADWNINLPKAKLTRVGTDLYQFVIKPNPRNFYNVPQNEKIKQIAFVFRSADRTREGKDTGNKDIYLPIFELGLNISILSPKAIPYFVNKNDTMDIKVAAHIVPSGKSSLKISLYKDNNLIYQASDDTINYKYVNNENFGSSYRVITVVAEDTSGLSKTDTIKYFPNPVLITEDLPRGVNDGINYINNSTATLVLYAPDKRFSYVLGDFNNWKVDSSYFMKQTADRKYYWLTINNLTPQQEYAFQYYVDGEVKIADPYTEKILDPWNDQYIPASVYPNLKPYPAGKTDNIVSVLQTGQAPYQWQVNNFPRPAQSELVIYELLIRDFTTAHSYKALKDTISYLKNLGISAIELMPVNEFEGNDSWGYNPSFYFAPDKYYGTKNDLKALIDEAHKNGIAVIIDMVLNHSYGLSPLVRLYWDSENNRPAANNPWYNVQSPNQVFSWGYDFNHESSATKKFVDSVTTFWMTEYKVDGFRFDFTKGFTNKPGDGQAKDDSRIAILTRMYNAIKDVDSTAYVILEHLADNNEEAILSSIGMMLWGNMNYQYRTASKGRFEGASPNFSQISYKVRGWQNPYLVGYMESHDEERLMYENLINGARNGDYNIKDTSQALNRIKIAAAFFLTVPGPKMIWQFGELGYDYTINFNGRTGPKPVRWDYYNDSRRKKLYKVFQALIKLRKENPAFHSNDFTLSGTGLVKQIHINHSSMNVTIIGNFDAVEKTINPAFQNAGMWYDYFSGDSLNVINTQDVISLQPGEFHIYTTEKLPVPESDILTDVTGNNSEGQIKEYKLEQNYPNPFNPATVISYTIPASPSVPLPGKAREGRERLVSLKVYDILGREIATLVNKEQGPGKYQVRFDAHNLSSGVYIYTLKAGDFTASEKMMLIR